MTSSDCRHVWGLISPGGKRLWKVSIAHWIEGSSGIRTIYNIGIPSSRPTLCVGDYKVGPLIFGHVWGRISLDRKVQGKDHIAHWIEASVLIRMIYRKPILDPSPTLCDGDNSVA